MTFSIYFSGHLIAGMQQAQVAENLQTRMKLSGQQLARLFSGERVLLKRGLDQAAAQRYRDTLAALGARVEVNPPLPEPALTLSAEAPRQPAQALDPAPVPGNPYAGGPATPGHIFCHQCGARLPAYAAMCPHCGARQQPPGTRKSRAVAAILAFLFGWAGGHRLYLGQWWGVLYLLLSPVMWLVALIEAIVFACTPRARWDNKYGNVRSSAAPLVLAVVGIFFAIIVFGILAAVAIPAYQDYTQRSMVSAAIFETATYREKVEAMVARTHFVPASNLEVGLDDALSTAHASAIVIGPDAVMTITLRGKAPINGATLVWTPDFSSNPVSWDCSGGTLAARYRPSRCRDENADYPPPLKAATSNMRHHSDDGLDSVVLTGNWQPLAVPNATLAYVNADGDIGMSVLRERKSDFDSSLTLEGYRDLLLRYSFNKLENLHTGDSDAITINGLPAYLFEVSGNGNGYAITFLTAAVESDNNFYKISAWTGTGSYADRKQKLETVIRSFRVKGQGSPRIQ